MAIRKDWTFTYHIQQDRERKNLAILELIRKKGPISKAEISRTLGYNIVTITNYLDYYIDKRIILEMGLDVSSGGRRPELLELNAKSAYIVGVDLGPESINAVVADLKVNVIAKNKSARPRVSIEDLIPYVVKVIDDTIRKSKIDQINIKNMGIGVSGIVDYPSGTIRDTDPTRGRTKVSFLKFASSVEEKFGVPVYIGNDASCAAFGEKTLNPAAGFDNVIYLYSDVGCGIVINGDVYIGSSGCAGETQLTFNSHQVDDKDRPPEYVHLRPWGVDLGVVYEAGRVIDKGAATEILNLAKGDKNAITKEIIIDAAKKGDRVAVELLNNAGRNLGIRIAYLINLLNPSVVVIGGGMERAGDLLFESVKTTMKRYSFEEPSSIVKVMPSLLGEDAIILGVAALAAREVFIQV